MLFRSTNACYIVYDRNAGTIALVWDSARGSDSRPVSGSAALQNSQCSIGAGSAVQSGLSQIITLSITFKGTLSGAQNIYMYGSEGQVNTGWVQRGTYNVAAGGTPVATSVVPNSGTGPAQRFSFTVSDAGGAGFLTGLGVLINSAFDLNRGCYLVFDRNVNTVALSYDTAANGSTPLTPGSATSASNSQCTLQGANTTVVTGTTTLVVTLDLTFNSSFFGSKNIYLYAAENGANSGWVNVGTWNVTGGAPTADFVLPSSGAGATLSETFGISDSSSAANLVGGGLLFTSGAPTNLAHACYLFIDQSSGVVGLYGDDGATLRTKPIGSSATLSNSQCAIGYTVVKAFPNNLVFTANIVFSSTFSGTKSTYVQAFEPGTSSGWVLRGLWIIP